MARARVVIEGDDRIRREMEKIVDGVEDLREVGGGAARFIAERAYTQVPVASGALKNDIRTFASKRNAGVRVGRKRLPYAGPVIGGHGAPGATRPQGGYMAPPNPFLFDAADERVGEVVATYERFIEALVDGRKPKSEHKYRLHEAE